MTLIVRTSNIWEGSNRHFIISIFRISHIVIHTPIKIMKVNGTTQSHQPGLGFFRHMKFMWCLKRERLSTVCRTNSRSWSSDRQIEISDLYYTVFDIKLVFNSRVIHVIHPNQPIKLVQSPLSLIVVVTSATETMPIR